MSIGCIFPLFVEHFSQKALEAILQKDLVLKRLNLPIIQYWFSTSIQIILFAIIKIDVMHAVAKKLIGYFFIRLHNNTV